MTENSAWEKILFLPAVFILLFCLATQLTGCFNRSGREDIVIGLAWPFATKNSMLKEGVELAVDELIDDHQRHVGADQASPERNHVGVVVLAGHPG